MCGGRGGSVPASMCGGREVGRVGAPGCDWGFQRSREWLAAGRVRLAEIVSHQFRLDELQRAFDLLVQPGSPAIKVAVVVDEK